MKIGIDISAIVYGTGVSVYTENLLKNLLKCDKVNNYLLAGYSFRRIEELKKFSDKLKGKFEEKYLRLPPSFFEVLWNRLRIINFETIFGDVDIYHSSDWTQAPSNAYKVTTVHDLVPILYPQYSLPSLVSVHKRRLEIVKKEVDRIIVPSNQTRQDLLKLNFNDKKIVVIPEGIDTEVRSVDISMKTAVKEKFRISKPFFLSIGITPRKNLDRILAAFKNINKKNEFDLVVVGEAKTGIKKDLNVIFTGFISHEELIVLYSSAVALVYPSLYEGFGLPILQALQRETPVITSNLGSMKEIGEESCVLVDPFSIESIEEGMKKVLRKPEINNLKLTLNRYSWVKNAKSTLRVYQELIS